MGDSASEDIPDRRRRRFVEEPSESFIEAVGELQVISESHERLRLRPLEDRDGGRGSVAEPTRAFKRGFVASSA